MDDIPIPASVRGVAAYDRALADAIAEDFRRLARVASAVTWAHAKLPSLLVCASRNDVLELLVREARKLTGVPVAWAAIWNGNPDEDTVSFRAIAGVDPSVPAPREVSRTVVGRVVREGRPTWSDDAGADERFAASASVVAYAIRSVACIPVGGNGVIYLADPTTTGRFPTEARLRLTALATTAAPFLAAPELAAPADKPRPKPVPGIIGETPAMAELFATIHAFAPAPWPALVLGETGVGKESVARALHTLSPRKKAPFIAVNCGAIPDDLAESTLFGHERGAFTGADRRHDGVVERVNTGTLFLDEVGELSARAQVKLLRLLQEGTYTAVGGTEERSFAGRVVAATHRPLTDSGTRAGFRDDLYHRLAACVLVVPPLRSRRDDIPLLAAHLAERACAQLPGSPALPLTRGALAALVDRAWPGNVRELENVLRTGIARALANGDHELRSEHVSPAMVRPSSEASASLHAATDRFMRARVHAALEAAHGNRTHAALALGVSRQWLHRLLARWQTT